jgi:hypothetical protein
MAVVVVYTIEGERGKRCVCHADCSFVFSTFSLSSPPEDACPSPVRSDHLILS